MRFTKPAWVSHKDSADKKRLGIFSIDVHPDGSRVATGGLDAKIRIWSTLPMLRPEFDDSNEDVDKATAPPKALCTLSMHAGPVLAVRWSHSGKWLASGSDDTIIMIWDLDPNGGGKVWGSDDMNAEGWKALKRLPGHDSDVTDLAFAPEDRYLASVGLDSKVLIWSGVTLELIRKLDLHQGYVKGVCWDPVGQYLATQSDDKSVKIWNTTDWSLEASITQPFENSPGSTFFRRLSWSPDGAHITASNAMNNNGYVFVAAVISRSSWSSNISLVGHENTVEVSAYNPHIFRRSADKPVTTANICSVVALGSDDLAVSIWQTKSARPLIVAKDVFERPVMDLSWSLDGLTLYACSSDGTICIFDFDESELEGIAPLSVQAEYLQLFNFVPPPIARAYVPQPRTADYDVPSVQARTPFPPVHAVPTPFSSQPSSQAQNSSGRKKRRIKPVFVSHLSSTPGINGVPTASSQPSVNGAVVQPFHSSPAPQPFGIPHRSGTNSNSVDMITPTIPNSYGPSIHNDHADEYTDRFALPAPYPGESSSYLPSTSSRFIETNGPRDDMDKAEMWDSLPENGASNANGINRVAKARTLGGDRRRESVSVIKEIRPAAGAPMDIDTYPGPTSNRTRLSPPAIRNSVSVRVEDKEGDIFEGKNAEDGLAPSEVTLVSGKQTQFLDYVSPCVLVVCATSVFCAAALEDGSINVYSPTGRRLMPAMLLDSPCVVLEGCKAYLMAITATAKLYVWNIKLQRSHISPVSIQPLFSLPSSTILSATLRPGGSPVLLLSSGIAFSYDPALSTWLKVSEARWSQGSDAWEGKQRATAVRGINNSKGIISSLENSISDLEISDGAPGMPLKNPTDAPPWWNAALTLGHLETRLHSAKLLDSPSEYRNSLIIYAKRIAEEGFRGKAEELLKELCGPIYWKPTREEPWVSTVLGIPKRELLKDVMGIFARSKTLAKLGQDWQEMMKKAQAE